MNRWAIISRPERDEETSLGEEERPPSGSCLEPQSQAPAWDRISSKLRFARVPNSIRTRVSPATPRQADAVPLFCGPVSLIAPQSGRRVGMDVVP